MSERAERAVKAAHAEICEESLSDCLDLDWGGGKCYRAVHAALPHLTTEDLRDTPAGRALVAQGKSLGWDDAIGELRKGQGLHRALAGTLSTRKPSYEEAT